MQAKERLRRDHPKVFALLRGVNGARIAALAPIRRARIQLDRRRLYRRVLAGRPRLLAELGTKTKIRVAFVVMHRAVWKLDSVFRSMLVHPQFEPFVVIAPQIGVDETYMLAEQRRFEAFFVERGWPVHVGARRADGDAPGTLRHLRPDIVFLTTPHRLTTPAFYDTALENCLTCYVPYSMDVSHYSNSQTQYNLPFHNVVWKIFAPHRISLRTFQQVQDLGGGNAELSGYPGIESLLEETSGDPWKRQPHSKLRIIWAPHHTIDVPELPYANFLQYATLFQELVTRHSDTIQWSFKPHPLLKQKLLVEPGWGPERTEAYFEFWQHHDSAQLDLGEYAELFRTSDAMIHDSGSFVAEYLYVDKPVMFLWTSPQVRSFFNEFGQAALAACERGDRSDDILRFVADLRSHSDANAAKRASFLAAFPCNYQDRSPSAHIVAALLQSWASARP